MGHPRLFLIKEDGAIEFSNIEMLEYMMRSQEKDPQVRKTHEMITYQNEYATSHLFVREKKSTDPRDPGTLNAGDKPVLP